MGYRCIRPDGARPCVVDIRFDAVTGNPLDKPIKRYKSVKLDGVVGWVDLCSRKHFEPTDKETRRQDEEDFADMKKELIDLGNDLPDDITFAECAESLARIKAMRKLRIAKKEKRLYLKNKPKKKKAISTEQQAEIADIKAQLDGLGVSYHPAIGLNRLKALLASKEKPGGIS